MCVLADISASVDSQRRHVFHSTAMTFLDARMECVANNGDLPVIENNADLEDVITNITTTTTTSDGAANSTGLDVL